MKTPFPVLDSDKAAEDFVASADLTDYDFSDMVPVRFELRQTHDEAAPASPTPPIGDA